MKSKVILRSSLIISIIIKAKVIFRDIFGWLNIIFKSKIILWLSFSRFGIVIVKSKIILRSFFLLNINVIIKTKVIVCFLLHFFLLIIILKSKIILSFSLIFNCCYNICKIYIIILLRVIFWLLLHFF